MSGKYTVTTLNVKGLRQPNKRKCIFQYLKTKHRHMSSTRSAYRHE